MTRSQRSPDEMPARAWKASIAVLDDEQRLKGALTPRDRVKIEKNIRRLNGKITPHKTTFAANANRSIVDACSAYFQRHGVPANFRILFRWLDQQKLLSGVTPEGKRWTVSETKLRRILHKVFHLHA